jgi:prepilin-type N-terminal cleavage/methylation domain-containing protein
MRLRLSASDSKGFTVTELVIVVAIIGLLATLAIPGFQNFIKKAKMVEAESALTEIKRLEERHFAEHLVYSNNLSTIGYTTPLRYYAITILLNGAGPPPFNYRITATADLDNDPDLDAWVFTSYTDGTIDLSHGCIPGGAGPIQFTCTD